MQVLDIVTFPDKFLNQKTRSIENIDGALQTLIDNMGNTMYHAPGIGLAAIQVGIDKSLLVYDINPPEDGRRLNVLINPKIISQEGEILSENEGCLSVPDFRADVKRAARILVEAVDRDGNPQKIEAEGLLAIVLQHEIDHLNGTLFIDHVSALKRQMYKRRVAKKLKQQ
ncbi:MAG: peptide deformylase [Desulfobacteraceae bacterium]